VRSWHAPETQCVSDVDFYPFENALEANMHHTSDTASV
jgi:hypothetical protein